MTPHPKGGNFGVKSVKLLYFLENLLLYSQALIRQTKYVVMMTKEGSTKIVNFMTPGVGVLVLGCGHISHIVKMHYFFKNLLFSSQVWVRQTMYKVMMIKVGSNENCKFHDSQGRDSCVKVWPYT